MPISIKYNFVHLFVLFPFIAAFSCSQVGQKQPEVPAEAAFRDSLVRFSIGNGVNLQPSYYNIGRVHFGWPLMKKYQGIKAVRIEIEPSVDIQTAKSWIAAAIDNGYEVIATYHKYTVLGSNDPKNLVDAAQWWKTNYHMLAQAGDFYINLMNEWGNHQLSVSQYAGACNSAIKIVRQVYSGPIILDCPGWGQETTIAAASTKGKGGIKDTNIVLSVHIYPVGWNEAEHHYLQKTDLDKLNETGVPCMIGEFGALPKGEADWRGLVRYAKKLGWPVFGWCWNGDGGQMNMVSPAWKENPDAKTFKKTGYFDRIYALIQ